MNGILYAALSRGQNKGEKLREVYETLAKGIELAGYIPLFGEDYIIVIYWNAMKIKEFPLMLHLGFNLKDYEESGDAKFSVVIVKFDRRPLLETFEREDFPSLPVSECTFSVRAGIEELSSAVRDKIVNCEGREFQLYDRMEMFDIFGTLESFYKPFVLFPAFSPSVLYRSELFVNWLLCALSMIF